MAVANLLSTSEDHRHYVQGAAIVVERFHAVLFTENNRVLPYHRSFPEFLFNPNRSGEFSIDPAVHHRMLTESCFRAMRAGLKFNIADISSSFLLDRDNSTLETDVKRNIPEVLAYSCLHWTHHLSSAGSINLDPLRTSLLDFLQLRALFWLEAMNLLGSVGRCDLMLRELRSCVLQVSINPTMRRLVFMSL